MSAPEPKQVEARFPDDVWLDARQPPEVEALDADVPADEERRVERLPGAAGETDRERDPERPQERDRVGEQLSSEAAARRLAGQMAACLQGALLVRHAPAEVADTFVASRLVPSYAGTFGTLDADSSTLRSLVERTTPQP